jgi:aspartate carbamoyltransferase regulatory subunit
LQIAATTTIRPGEEILAPYGVGYSRQITRALKIKNQEAEQAESRFIEEHFYRAGGAAARLHCKRCKKYVSRDKMKNHVLMCKFQ